MTFVLCWMAYAVSYVGRMNLAIAIPAMNAAGVASLSQLGMVGSLYFWFYGGGHLINGMVGDVIAPRTMVFGGLAFSGVCNALIPLVSTPAAVMVLWSVNGFVLSMLWGPIVRLLGERVSSRHHSTVSLLMTVSIGVGSFVSWFFLGRLVAGTADWRPAFWVPAVICLGFAGLWWAAAPRSSDETETEGGPQTEGGPGTTGAAKTASASTEERRRKDNASAETARDPFFVVFRRSRLALIVVAAIVQGTIKDGLMVWLPTLVRTRFPSVPEGAIVAWLPFVPVANVAGILLVTWFTRSQEIRYRRRTIQLFAAAALVIGVLLFTTPPLSLTLVMIGTLTCAIAYINSILLAYVPMQFRRSGRVSTVAGLLDFVSYMGAGAFALVSGTFLASGNEWVKVFGVLAAAVLVGAVVMLPTRKRIEE